jgi:hypothetical protein
MTTQASQPKKRTELYDGLATAAGSEAARKDGLPRSLLVARAGLVRRDGQLSREQVAP